VNFLMQTFLIIISYLPHLIKITIMYNTSDHDIPEEFLNCAVRFFWSRNFLAVCLTVRLCGWRGGRQAIKSRSGPVSLVLERSPPPVQADLKKKTEVPFNAGRVAFATWNGNILAYPYQGGTVGFLTFSSRYVMPKGLTSLVNATAVAEPYVSFTGRRQLGDFEAEDDFEVIASASDEDEEKDNETEWAYGDFNNDEYQAALTRAQKDFTYNPNRCTSYTKVSNRFSNSNEPCKPLPFIGEVYLF
jgi:hypothetical protein